MTDTATQEAPAKRTISPEQKAKMVAALAKGRATAAANRAARAAAPKSEPAPVVRRGSQMPTATQWNHKHEGRGEHIKFDEDDADRFDGLDANMCAAGCRDGYCVITEQNHCGHPHKGGIQAAHQTNPKIVANFHKARKILAHLAVDRK